MGFFDFFTNAPDSALVNTDMAYNNASFYKNKSEGFFDPNNSFYTKAMQRYNAQNLDSALALARQSARSRAANGITSNAINESIRKDVSAKASEDTQNFGQNLYGQGLGVGTQLAGLSQNYFSQGVQGDMQNAQANAQWTNSWLDLAGTAAGSAFGSGSFLGGGISALFSGTPVLSPSYSKGGQSAASYGRNTSAPVGYKDVPRMHPF